MVVDESQLLTSDCIELLRYLHDHRTTRFALVLVGGNGTWRVLSREPMLASRVYRRVRFQPLTRAGVLAAIPGNHPLYARAELELIRLIDDLFAHGNLRGRLHRQRPAARPRREPRRARRAPDPQRLRPARWREPLTAPSRSCSSPTTTSTRSLAFDACTPDRSAKSSASPRPAAAAPRSPTACSQHSARPSRSSRRVTRSGASSTCICALRASVISWCCAPTRSPTWRSVRSPTTPTTSACDRGLSCIANARRRPSRSCSRESRTRPRGCRTCSRSRSSSPTTTARQSYRSAPAWSTRTSRRSTTTTGSPAGSTIALSGSIRMPPTRSSRSRAAATPPQRSTSASAPRSTPSSTPA